MRLQLSHARLVLWLLLVPSAHAESPVKASVDARTGVYFDSDHTTISTTTAAARALIKDRVQIDVRYLVDVVSSASVDVVTAATSTIHDTRHELTVGAGYRDGTHTADLGYIYSRENDWESHTATLGGSRDFLQHNLTLGLGASLGFNDVGRSGDINFHRHLNEYGASASATFTPSPRDIVNISYTFAYLNGYQASPYRFIVYTTPQGLRASQPEVVPDGRLRNALTARWKRHVGVRSAVHLHLRGYIDDWQVVAATTGLEYLVELGRFTLGPHLRGYAQNHAAFYQAAYTERVNYMTFDRELATFVDGFFGLRALYLHRHLGPLEDLHVEAKLDGFGFYFFDFPRLQTRYGLVAELAIGVQL